MPTIAERIDEALEPCEATVKGLVDPDLKSLAGTFATEGEPGQDIMFQDKLVELAELISVEFKIGYAPVQVAFEMSSEKPSDDPYVEDEGDSQPAVTHTIVNQGTSVEDQKETLGTTDESPETNDSE